MKKTFNVYNDLIKKFKNKYKNCFNKFLTICLDHYPASSWLHNYQFRIYEHFDLKYNDKTKVCVTYHNIDKKNLFIDSQYINSCLYSAIIDEKIFNEIWSLIKC